MKIYTADSRRKTLTLVAITITHRYHNNHIITVTSAKQQSTYINWWWPRLAIFRGAIFGGTILRVAILGAAVCRASICEGRGQLERGTSRHDRAGMKNGGYGDLVVMMIIMLKIIIITIMVCDGCGDDGEYDRDESDDKNKQHTANEMNAKQ